MKYLPNIAGGLLGFVFLAFSMIYFFKLMDMPPPPADSPAGHFAAALGPTGYMDFVKVFEIIGGILVAIPRTRNFGLLILGPIIINILAFHLFIENGKDIAVPAVMGAIALYLLWTARGKFAVLRN